MSIENFNRSFEVSLYCQNLLRKGYIVLLAHKSVTRALVSFLPLKNNIYIEKE